MSAFIENGDKATEERGNELVSLFNRNQTKQNGMNIITYARTVPEFWKKYRYDNNNKRFEPCFYRNIDIMNPNDKNKKKIEEEIDQFEFFVNTTTTKGGKRRQKKTKKVKRKQRKSKKSRKSRRY